MSSEDWLTQRHGVSSASSLTACQSRQPESIMMYSMVSNNSEAQLKVQITEAVKYPSHPDKSQLVFAFCFFNSFIK